MIEQKVFIDHDGTLTDSGKEMADYTEIVMEFNAKRLRMPKTEIAMMMQAQKEVIQQDQGRYGWEMKSGDATVIVAPATSDCYQLNQAATNLMLKDLGAKKGYVTKLLQEVGGIEEYLSEMFKVCSPRLGTYYRGDTREFLTELEAMQSGGWAIVTNSGTQGVEEKIATLGLDFETKVVGGAKKYIVDRGWVGVVPQGPYKGFPGFPERGVELQRKIFYETMFNLTDGFARGLVFVEDIGEFVLWVDWLIENNTNNQGWSESELALVLTPNTPFWEKARFEDGTPHRFASTSLMEILFWINKK